MALNLFEYTLTCLPADSETMFPSKLKGRDIIAFYMKMENLLAAYLSCKGHQGPSGSWANLPFNNAEFLRMLKIIKKKMGDKFKNSKFLDVGCGFGMKCWLADCAGLEAHGIDFCKDYVKWSGKIFDKSDVEISKKNALTYDKYGEFDIIFAYQPIKNPINMAKLMKRIAEQMKVGTYFCGQVFNIIPALKEISDGVWQK